MNRQYGALCGLAMVLVVFNHAINMGIVIPAELGYTTVTGWPLRPLEVLRSIGIFAVPTFLFISGSFVVYAGRSDTTALSFRFVLSRLRYIIWPYVIWSLAFYILVYLQRGEQYALLGYVTRLVGGSPFHFVPLIIFFYILSPFLVRLGKRHSWLLLIVIGTYQLFLISVRFPNTFGLALPSWSRNFVPPMEGHFLAMSDWAIFFPMGVVFALHSSSLRPRLIQLKWLIITATAGLFFLNALTLLGVLNLPWAQFIAPFTFLFLVPIIPRNSIPQVRRFERVGRRAYGLYLTHLIVQDIAILIVAWLVPDLFNYWVILFTLLFILGLLVPLTLMDVFVKGPTRRVYRYAFG